MLLVWCHLLTSFINIEMFINKLTEASIQFNSDLSEAFTLNDLKFLLLNIIFSQINAFNLNVYILLDCI